MPEFRPSKLQGVVEIYPKVFRDERGYFFESYRQDWFDELGIAIQWKQDNQSYSQKGTIRGLHFQRPPHAQAKLVRVVQGKVLDVVVDLRKGSETYGQSHSVILNAEEQNLLYVPAGFAHGFSVLEDAVFLYKCSEYYHFPSEGGIRWDDPELQIDWMVDQPIISEKDQKWPTLAEFTQESEGGF
ncbi:MAG: dTDP-4-dehydrorhamnose 3,5-epimerase [Algoriphagus sp.]|uniref:dTDP-4-dehydrorhamnose 3,5-epimerase n=1 Tax=Algoriphagus sp. TaxID=1872435 RepID=UPI0017D862CF|nr:dTDP-4-dehydrorhamnose 3,5-epimerase [Algoriphagus sp.]NVJ87158.1 dTDP-4-dehydrorhamnose 3,5-epimerase [Algoriphagus sp.]